MGYVASKIRAHTARRNGEAPHPLSLEGREEQAMFHRLLRGAAPNWSKGGRSIPRKLMPSAKARKEIYGFARRVLEGSLSFKAATDLTADVWDESVLGRAPAARRNGWGYRSGGIHGLHDLPQTFTERTEHGETWEVEKRGLSHAIYRVKNKPRRAERIFVGDTRDYGPNVVGFWDKPQGELVDTSVVSYDSVGEALQALTSGSWYKNLPDRF